MNIDPELHRAVKGGALGTGLSVTRYVEGVLDEAVSGAQGARGERDDVSS
jgi:predicted HicB family RNase H-like nuclease